MAPEPAGATRAITYHKSGQNERDRQRERERGHMCVRSKLSIRDGRREGAEQRLLLALCA